MCTVIVLPPVNCCYFSNNFHLLLELSEGTAFLFNFAEAMKLYIKCTNRGFKFNSTTNKNVIIIIIIIIFIYCNWVVTRWQWLFYKYTKHEIGY